MADSTNNEEEEYCCIGLLEIAGTIVIDETTRTSCKYSGTITVKTITKCETDVKCKGKTWLNPFKYTTCDLIVKGFNVDAGVNISGDGDKFPMQFSLGGATNLGCCTKACPHKINTEVYEIKGTTPAGRFKDTVINQIADDYGFGGDVQKPKFKACCQKDKPVADRAAIGGVE